MQKLIKRRVTPLVSCRWLMAIALAFAGVSSAETFRVATYNLENYHDTATQTRKTKSPESRAKVRESILAMKPDVIAFQEIGSETALLELQKSLKTDGLEVAHREFITGWDTNNHLAILSRFPFSRRRPHTNDTFLLNGRRFKVSRGFAELDITVTPDYTFTLFAAHLKARRAVPEADEAEMRFAEARILREKVDARLKANPEQNIIVLGDLNDTYGTPSTKAVVGRGRTKLVDTRPAEQNGGANRNPANGASASRSVTWTHYYAVEDSYSRIDYIMLSSGMAKEWRSDGTYILTLPDWGVASDHRPLVAAFEMEDK